MAIYAIGDVQGCYDELRRLVEQLDFDPDADKLWFVGDLVNRGPESLAVLRWVRSLGTSAVVVLGNHDLHLLAIAAGNPRQGKKDTLDEVLAAPDRDELLHWLRHRPLLHWSEKKAFALIHAGLPPQWDLTQAQACARELEAVLRGPDHRAFLNAMYGNEPARWSADLQGLARLRFITNCFTRLRYCTRDGTLCLDEKALLGSQPAGVLPWFAVPGRASADTRILFGHWSTIGYCTEANTWALDSGCLWGGTLTAIRVRRRKPMRVFSVDCDGYVEPTP